LKILYSQSLESILQYPEAILLYKQYTQNINVSNNKSKILFLTNVKNKGIPGPRKES
jgi:hypothetical protein